MSGPDHPKLRNLEAIPVEHDGESLVLLRDPEGLAEHPVVLSPGAMLVLVQFDGNHSVLDIQANILRHTGQLVTSDQIAQLIHQLDEAYLLDSPHFGDHRRAVEEEFRRQPVRPPAHAGGAYRSDPEQLRRQLEELFTCPGGPGKLDGAQPQGRLRGVLSPHIDLARGGPTFAWAYKELAEQSDATVFVIFGTAHNPTRHRFSLTRKDFQTPFGLARTDQAFLDRMVAHCGEEFFEDELAHRQEHSIEFQVVFLQFLLDGRRDFRIVPILVGSFHDLVVGGQNPREDPEVRSLVEAVCEAEAASDGKLCYVCGGDLAHIGPRFGDPERLTDADLERMRDADAQLLQLAVEGDADGLFEHISRDQDQRRVCGFPPTYTLLEVMGGLKGRLLKYDQAVDESRMSCVSFASVGFYRDAS